MKRSTELSSLLRWYPLAWRERYGQEMTALMEDTLGEGRASVTLRVSTAWAGLRERGREAGLIAEPREPAQQLRAGSLLVLGAWAVFVVAGASYSKSSEHFAGALPAGSNAVAQDAFNVVAVLALAAAALVAVGAALCVPSFAAFIRTGGWSAIRRRVYIACGLSIAAVAATVPLLIWAHSLTGVQRNGANHLYSSVFIVWVLLMALTLATWTAAGVAAARRLDLSPRVLRLEGALAVGVATLMVGVTIATALWWESMASNAPWFLQGTAIGSPASALTLNLAVTMALMVIAGVAGLFGATRVTRSWRSL